MKLTIPIVIVSIIVVGATLFFYGEGHSFPNDKSSVLSIDKGNSKQRLSQVKVVSLYENINDGALIGRSIDQTIGILKETKTDLIFRGFWKWAPVVNSPDNIPPELLELAPAGTTLEQAVDGLRKSGHYYQELKKWVSAIKKELPDIIFVGAIPVQTLARLEYNPITGKVYSMEETWGMALDPAKWSIKRKGKSVTKEQFQSWFYEIHPYGGKVEKYDWRKVSAYFPDITNPVFQDLLLSWVKKQIDCGADGIWIDMLYHQVTRLAQVTGDMNHPSVRESVEAASKIVDEIHKYGKSKGKYIYVGTWDGPFVSAELIVGKEFPYSPPDVDFITTAPTPKEVQDKKLNSARWGKEMPIIKKKFGGIPVFVFIDWAFDESQMVTFSQKLSKEEQREVLKTFDESFTKMGVNFVYPVHGGYMGRGEITTKLAWGKYRIYDALAPEFQTYERIKELARNKNTKQSNLILPSQNNAPFSGLSLEKEKIPITSKKTISLPDKSWIYEGIIYRTHPVFYPNHSFKEITRQIPSLKDLGVKTVLLAPFWSSPKVPGFGPATMSYHPLSYYKINPEYGNWDDLKDLIKTAHKYDMKVMLDIVTGVAEPGSDWYDYGTFKVPLEELKKKYKLEYMEKGGYNIAYYNRYKSQISEITGEDFYDIIGIIDKDNNVVLGAYPNPKVGIATDRKNPKVIEYFENVVTYYVKEYDVDGFRIDMPSDVWNKLLFPEDHTIYEMLGKLKAAAIKEKPNVLFQAESVNQSLYNPQDTTEQTCEISSEVTLPQFYAFKPALFANSEKFVESIRRLINFPYKTDSPYKRSRRWQLENLNTPRVNVQFKLAKLSPDTLKALVVMMSTLPGTPLIVAGQEIGETQEGGSWGTGNHEFFTTKPEVDWNNGDNGLKDFYKKVFAIRNSHPALGYGGDESISNVWKSGDNTFAYSRTYENETVIVVINFNGKQVESVLDIPFPNGTQLKDELSGEIFTVADPANFKITVPAYGSRILTIN